LNQRVRAAAAFAVALFSECWNAAGQQMPPSGCMACAGAGHGPTSSAVPLFEILGPVRTGAVPAPHLQLPPPPATRDDGAVEASTRIVLGRHRKLRENLAIASAANRTPRPEVTPRPGEILIRVASTSVAPPKHREDVPRSKFEAIPLRGVSYPQWSPTSR